jgi:hypothetical protein
MLRFKILVSIVPLIAVAIFARIELSPTQRPCIAIGAGTVELGSDPWHADLHVGFTDDPALATVRVALADSPEAADFVVVDDNATTDDTTCGVTAATQFVAIAADPTKHSPLIYLAESGPADYRIFVRSSRFSVREAAALIVAAHAGNSRLADTVL